MPSKVPTAKSAVGWIIILGFLAWASTLAREDGRAGTTGEGAEKPAGEASMDAGYETVMTPSGVPETRKRTPRVFPREEVAAYKPIGASNCYRHFTLDWNWQGGDINDYFKRSDPVAVAEFCQDINLDAVILLAVSHHGYATYPSAYAPQFPALQGRDWYGETIRECHKRGIAVLGYISLARNWWYDDVYPDRTWQWGKETLCDLNTPFLDYVVSLSKELLESYPIDGLRYDTLMQDPNSRNKWSKEIYRELYGEDMPEKWDATNWRRMRDFQRWSTTRATRMLTEANKSVKPAIETWQNGFIQQKAFDENDLEAGRFQDVGYIEAGDPFRQLLFTGALRLRGTIVGHMFGMDPKTRRVCMALGARAYQFKAVNRETALPDDKQWYYDNMKPFYGMIHGIQPYLEGARTVPYIGLVYGEATRYRTFDYDRDWYVYGILKPLAMSFLEQSKVVESVMTVDLATGDFSHLPAMVLAETSGLRPDEIEGLRRYVKQGGQLLVAGEALRHDERGAPRDDFSLAEEMGVSYVKTESDLREWRTVDKSFVEEPSLDVVAAPKGRWKSLEYPKTLRTREIVSVRPVRGETVLRVKSPDGPIPLLHTNVYGKGRVTYLAATQDLDFVRSIIDFLAGPPPVRCEPPDRQAVLTYQKEQGRWALHLVDDGDYVVHTHRAFAEPEKVVGLYPAEGWQAQAEATENGLRIEVSGAAKDRILVLK